MAVFGKTSRYVNHANTYEVKDRRGRIVQALTPASIPEMQDLGRHLRKEGQRIDHLANYFLRDPTQYWKIVAHNKVVLPEALTEADEIKIPVRM